MIRIFTGDNGSPEIVWTDGSSCIAFLTFERQWRDRTMGLKLSKKRRRFENGFPWESCDYILLPAGARLRFSRIHPGVAVCVRFTQLVPEPRCNRLVDDMTQREKPKLFISLYGNSNGSKPRGETPNRRCSVPRSQWNLSCQGDTASVWHQSFRQCAPLALTAPTINSSFLFFSFVASILLIFVHVCALFRSQSILRSPSCARSVK
jgi:hypothetical protein